MNQRLWFLIGLLSLLTIVAISGCTDNSNTSQSIPKDQLKQEAIDTTTAELWQKSIKEGTPVKVQGETLQKDDNYLRMNGVNMSYGYNMDTHDIFVFGDFSGVTLYEHDGVVVYGIVSGPYTYETAMGAERTVPSLTNGYVEPTGKSYS
ncbi:hypothetical protein [Methanobacterium oryzae]|uniref:hypothetical protein n=1 Tax=Methanobacterium oryzae TaxID=69540 RepID=UPI003D215239